VRSRDQPDTYVVYARFKDEAAFHQHQATPFHDRLVPPILATVAGEMDLKFFDFVA
jgi:quinol monooxygenase YgiN